MEAKVKISFRNKYTHNLHLAGEIIEVSKERYEEIEKVREGILEPLEPVPEETQEENQEETPEAKSYTKSELKKMNVEELKKLAEEKGVSAEGKKDEIIERLVELEENDAQ
ncbi:SAP domain-containing protein [Dorea formicigenerans]|uniref:SAP domain-containing protein n=1 Tax=Dorea formicigenerans TaxID=39486 RepID=A0A415MTC6_9FIRM|nr:SAP domain-containing protein [Dorea formicigenerans]RHL84340.1 hypothetical protein DWZ98_15630 [Dorea formicigenerans]